MPRFYEEIVNGFLFQEYDAPEIDTLILGLPDVGLVGAITAIHLIKELNMKDIVGIDNYTALPPVAVIMEGKPKLPIRIYAKDNLGVLVTDVPLAPSSIPLFSEALVRYAKSRGVKTLISVTGLGNPGRIEIEKPNLYLIGSNQDDVKQFSEKLNPKDINQGILVGPYAIILKESIRLNLNNIVLMVDSFIDIPDPGAAAVAIESLNKILDLDIDVTKLLEEEDKIKLRLKELMKETKNVMARMGKTYEYRPTLIYT
ncbi:MAG: PAC2 family protein [Desulfurococcales archaeon]|nr:PAC2 family protein [Desulfurococcales archaeon]